jgi:DNA-binding transcriptional MerR regulator
MTNFDFTAPIPPGAYRSPDAARLAGISYRQLDFWVRTGIIPQPSIAPGTGTGTQRLFSRTDITRMATISALLDAGLSVQVAARMAANLGKSTTRLSQTHGLVTVSTWVPIVDFEVAA